ncbi:30S ribosomal protein S7 [Paenibacillus rhizoplanae]
MPRKGPVTKRDVLPDPLYNSKLVTRLINRIMLGGKRGVAQSILYNSFKLIQERTGKEPMEVFLKQPSRISCLYWKLKLVVSAVLTTRYLSRLNLKDVLLLGLRWLVNYSRNRGEKTMEERLAAEIIDASNNTGASVKKREDTHKMAEANKAFAHYRW